MLGLSILQVNDGDDSGWTPLIIASSAGHIECVQLLLSLSPSLDSHTHTGQTALHYAASRNRLAIAEQLITAGAKVSACMLAQILCLSIVYELIALISRLLSITADLLLLNVT